MKPFESDNSSRGPHNCPFSTRPVQSIHERQRLMASVLDVEGARTSAIRLLARPVSVRHRPCHFIIGDGARRVGHFRCFDNPSQNLYNRTTRFCQPILRLFQPSRVLLLRPAPFKSLGRIFP